MLYKELKKIALNDLYSYYYMQNSLETLPKEISMLKESALYRSPSVGTGVMCSKTSDGPIIKLLSRIENLENQLEYNRSRLQNIDCALNALRTSQRDILFDYYIRRHRKSVCRLAIDSHTDRSALYRRANRALDKYILAFFGTMGDKNAL